MIRFFLKKKIKAEIATSKRVNSFSESGMKTYITIFSKETVFSQKKYLNYNLKLISILEILY